MHGIITTNGKLLLQRYIIKRLLTVYRKIFGTRSYGGDALASSCILRHMNSCRIFYDIQSITYKYYILRLFPVNKNIKMSSFKSSENIQKKEVGPDRSVSDNQSSSVTLNELAMKARKQCFSKEVIH